PENVLIRRHVTGSGPSPSAIVVEAKIADFGLVHDMDFSRPLTDYISTRWYRAPEVLLNCANYSTPIDVWAVGTIVSELATLRPLFPGTNQIDQLRRIFEVLGTPRISTGADEQSPVEGAMDGGSWYEGAVHARKLGIAFVPSTRRPVASVMPDVSAALTQLVDYLLVLNPANRPTARDALVVVSRMLDHTLGEAQEYEAVDPPNHQLPDEDERRVPVVEPPVAAVPAKRLLRIPPIMGKTRSTGTIDTTSSVAPATPVSATPPVVPVVSRPSVEINIVHELHREPMRDPRADLSDLAVAGFKGPQSRVRSRSVSSVSSLGSTTPRSMAVSPDNSVIFGSSGIASTSSTDLPVAPPGLPGQQVSMRSAIGKTSLLSALAQEELAKEQRLSLQRPRAMAGARMPSASSSETSHIRRAGAIAELGPSSSQVPGSSASSTISTSVNHYSVPRGNADKRKSEYTADSDADSGNGYVPLRSNGVQQTAVQPQANDRVQGLRSGGVLGSPLIRRALSMKKKTSDTTSDAPSSASSQAPSKASSLLKRSRSALLVANQLPATGTNLLELSPDVQVAVGERIDLSSVGADPPAPSVSSSGKAKKDEWIANMQFLRQRLASNNIGGGGSSTTSGNESSIHLLAPRGVRRCSASSDRPADGFVLGGSRYTSTASKRSSVAATPVRDITSLMHMESTTVDDDDDFLGVRRAMHRVLLASPLPVREENDQSSVTLPSITSTPASAATADGGRDLFAPVTFDAAALFRQSLLDNTAGSATVEPPLSYREDAVMPSPGDKISTFNDVRIKYSSRKPGAPTPSVSGTAGGHRFLSKVKNALTGHSSNNRSPDTNSGRLSSHTSRHGRAKSSGNKTEVLAGSSPSAVRQQVAPPRLDFDLGISLLTPESLHRVPNKDDVSVQRTEPAAVVSQPVVANDSAYYLIDYINGQQPLAHKERSDSYATPGAVVSSSAAAKARAARRVVNTSTRSRQTQYEYSFGSQIFECLDKDLVLLKTDAFREIEEHYGVSSSVGQSVAQPYAQRLSNSLAVHKQFSGRPAAPRRKPMDVTKVTAKTAAAINNIVAGNAKARSNVVATASSTTTNSSARQLVI
ncbi:Serine/threonine protein kinase, partial [Coemansia sp. S3946]